MADDDTNQDVPDDSDAATRLGYAGDNTPPSPEAAGPPQEGVPETPPKRTREEEIAKQQVDRDASGQKSVLDKIQGLFTGEPDTFGIGAAVHEGMAGGDRNDPVGSAISGIRDWLTGKNASSKADLGAAIQRANPDGSLDPSVATHKAIADEQDPVRKDALMGRAMHTYREARAHARVASDNNNWNQADAFTNEGMNYLPDGTKAQFTRHNNGIVATVSHLGTDKQDVVNMTPQQYSAWLHSDASDADTIMRTGLVSSLQQASAPPRGAAGPGGPPTAPTAAARPDVGADYGPTPSQLIGAGSSPVGGKPPNAPVGVAPAPGQLSPSASYDDIARGEAYAQAARGNAAPANPMAQREADLAARAQERRVAGAQGTSFENAANLIDRAQSRGFATQPLELRRDAEGNLWTKDPRGNVVPYRNTGIQYAGGAPVPSPTQGLSPTEAREFANQPPVEPGPQRAAVGSMPAPTPVPQPRGVLGTQGQQVQPQGEEPTPPPPPPAAARPHKSFQRRGGHRRRHNQGA